MKKLIILTFLIIGNISHSQVEIIKSIELDSLIYDKINDYRGSIGKDPLIKFETETLRDHSDSRTETNSTSASSVHSGGVGPYNGECLYYMKISFLGRVPDYINQNNMKENFEYLASECVNGWINSPGHQYVISHDELVVGSVVSKIIVEKNRGDEFVMRLYVTYNSIYESGYATVLK